MKWNLVRLTDVCDFQGGTQPPKSGWSLEPKPGYVRMLQIRDFTQGKDSFVEYVKDSKNLKKCIAQDIMIGRYGASIGKILTGLSGAYNVALVKTVPSDKINRRYLYFYLLSNTFQNFIQNAGSRAAQAGFNKEELGTLFLRLPPIHIQEQIANNLQIADALRNKDHELLTKFDQLAQAIFYDMFGDPVKNDMGWEVKNLSALSQRIVVGHVGPTSHGYAEKGVPFLRTQNVREGFINFENINFITQEFHATLKKSVIHTNDVLISRVGVNRGMAAVVPKELDGSNCANIIIVGRTTSFNPQYLSYYLNHTFGASAKFGYSVGSAQGVVNTSMVKAWNVLVPPVEFQQRFADVLLKGQQMRSHCQKNEELSNKLFSKTLDSFFEQ